MLTWLKDIRDKKGLSQASLAHMVGISQQHYSFIESGERGVRVPIAKKIAAALGFDWQRFYEDEGGEQNDRYRC